MAAEQNSALYKQKQKTTGKAKTTHHHIKLNISK